MITGLHAILYSHNAEADRAFLRDVLGLPAVDAGGGWLIFAGPPSEIAVHPDTESVRHEIYLMCDDIKSEMNKFAAMGVPCSAVQDEGWGLLTSLKLPGGSTLGLYEPRHPTALGINPDHV